MNTLKRKYLTHKFLVVTVRFERTRFLQEGVTAPRFQPLTQMTQMTNEI